MTKIAFRTATMKDVKTIQQVEQAAFGVHIIKEELAQILDEGKGDVFLAFQNDVPCAYLVVLYEDLDENRL